MTSASSASSASCASGERDSVPVQEVERIHATPAWQETDAPTFAKLLQTTKRPAAGADAHALYDWLYRACWRSAHEFACRLIGDPCLAEDVAQQAFLGVWTHWETVQLLPERAQIAYALRATRNAATDALRHRGGHPGGIPRSLYAPLRSAQTHGGASEWSDDLTYANVFIDATPDHDPERYALGREALASLLEDSGKGTLRRLEILLTAHGYGSREIADVMRLAARLSPGDPYAYQYHDATPSSIKMRRSRRRITQTRLQAQQAQQQAEEEES